MFEVVSIPIELGGVHHKTIVATARSYVNSDYSYPEKLGVRDCIPLRNDGTFDPTLISSYSAEAGRRVRQELTEMQEWVLVLKMMTADHQKWPIPPAPAPIVAAPAKPARKQSDEARAELRRAVEQMAREATGELRYDEATGFYVPVRRASGDAGIR